MAEASTWTAEHGDLSIGLTLTGAALTWSVRRGTTAIGSESSLVLRATDGRTPLSDLTFIAAESRRVEETYELVVGKRAGRHHVDHHERTVRFAGPCGEVAVVLRAAADGVALRVMLEDPQQIVVTGGDLTLSFPASSPVWPLTYTPWYETTRFTSTLGELTPGDYGFPLLVQSADDTYVLVTESDVDGRYGGSFARYEGSGRLVVTLAADVALDRSPVATPWRVLIVGDLATVVESHLVDDLAPASAGPPPLWAKPGRGAWSWWSDFYSGAHLDKQLRMLDYAAARGWEYLLVDCGWDSAWMPELVAAASRYGIGVFVWVAWDQLARPDQRAVLAEWAAWGVAGIKVDFMESEEQVRYRWYDAVIAECGRRGLMVNFHGSVIPRGWARTYPHVMSYEAVRGAEYYVFYGEPLTAEHNTIVPFTRNVVGSADYTPVTFSAPGRQTTEAHELALSVVLESGVQHFADEIAQYARRPVAEGVLERVPAQWDETRLLGGTPGDHVVLARRSGTSWFVGVISATPTRTVPIDLSRLTGRLSETVTVIVDGMDGQLIEEERRVSGSGRIEVDLQRNGGALVLIDPPTALPRVEQPAVRIEQPVLIAEPGKSVEVTAILPVAVPASAITPPGWQAAALTAHETLADSTVRLVWTVTVPDPVPAGTVGVVTVHAGEVLGAARPVVGHARVCTPLAPGTTPLVGIRPIEASNGYGPVERDMSNGGGDPGDGRTMTVVGTEHASGLGVCAPARVAYALGGASRALTVQVAVDDESETGATAVCQVLGDGRVLAEQPVVHGAPPATLTVDLTGVLRVDLVTAGSTDAHVDWIEPVVLT